MSFRLEKKFVLDPRKYEMFVNYLYNLKANQIHEKRTVFSTYYDNDYHTSYRNSEEGITPRKKMRIRSAILIIIIANQSLSLKYQLKQIDLKK